MLSVHCVVSVPTIQGSKNTPNTVAQEVNAQHAASHNWHMLLRQAHVVETECIAEGGCG